ncbi:MAG: carbon starvation protein A [Thermoguttaceae bacterium]|nr:carbon starvation protein A [Thermoguttaceae bacterium]MDW8039010.1 carbon starvation protein A [Thermoguttaceae bacterium]
MLHNAMLIGLVSLGALVVAYFTYGRFLARRVFCLDPNYTTPSHALRDGIDYVPTRPPILFGHHFASIAGLGPILGPALAVIWGWLPALLWVVLGSIFIGAVHDMGALYVSLHHQGRSIGEVSRHVIGPRARLLSLLIIFFMMSVAMGAFCSTLADLFLNYNPDAIIPTFGLMLVAVAVGLAVYRFRAPLGLTTTAALVVFAGLILYGIYNPVLSYRWFCSAQTRQLLDTVIQEAENAPARSEESEAENSQTGSGGKLAAEKVPVLTRPYGATAVKKYLEATGTPEARQALADLGSLNESQSALGRANYAWIAALLAYAFLASVLPVWLLLQPRDYINSFQLYFMLIALFIGLLIAGLLGSEANRVECEPVRTHLPDALPWMPFLFVTVACGAVSGFHSLVSSGTTVKQLDRETHALPIGYGGMLTEAALAVLVIVACVAGNTEDWAPGGIYASWSGLRGAGLAGQLHAMFHGGSMFLQHLGIPAYMGRTLLAVTVVAFALTTLDSATRLLRFNVEELCRALRLHWLANRYVGSAVAVAGIAFFALVPAGQTLWRLFGTVNQMLAGLALLVVSVFLWQLRRPVWYTLLPMIGMLIVSTLAMLLSIPGFWKDTKLSVAQQWALSGVSGILIAMAGWLVVEALVVFAKGRSAQQNPK